MFRPEEHKIDGGYKFPMTPLGFEHGGRDPIRRGSRSRLLRDSLTDEAPARHSRQSQARGATWTGTRDPAGPGTWAQNSRPSTSGPDFPGFREPGARLRIGKMFQNSQYPGPGWATRDSKTQFFTESLSGGPRIRGTRSGTSRTRALDRDPESTSHYT